MFYANLELPELDNTQTIKELLRVKFGLISLPLFDVSQVDFMLRVSVYSVITFTVLLYSFITNCILNWI